MLEVSGIICMIVTFFGCYLAYKLISLIFMLISYGLLFSMVGKSYTKYVNRLYAQDDKEEEG
jgi:uncharacterized membrane protein YjdF